MFISLISRLFGRTATPISYDQAMSAVAVEMASPVDLRPITAKPDVGRPVGRKRVHKLYSLDVGKAYVVPFKKRNAVSVAASLHGKATGKRFTTKTTATGVWVRRVA